MYVCAGANKESEKENVLLNNNCNLPQRPGLEVKGAVEEASLQQSRHTVEVMCMICPRLKAILSGWVRDLFS